ncbi:MAG: glycosyltransferase family 4 protein [Actinomycetota bacterium]
MTATPNSTLKIALVAPVWFEVPPSAYGGIEWVCAWLADGLLARGHEVTLIAAGRPGTGARFLQTYAQPPSERLGESMPEAIHAAAAEAHLRTLDLDIVHDHTLCGPLTARGRRAKTLVTAHGPVSGELGSLFRQLGDSVSLIAISNSQRAEAPDLNWSATVYNAIPVDQYPMGRNKEDFVLFLGRMSPDKGAHLAIEAARRAGRRLVLAGKCNEPAEKAYFERDVVPLLGPDVDWIGQADSATKKDLMARAHCFLFPIRWSEPFGLVMVEAMACGTAVVALRGGSVGEIVVHGRTGFIAEGPSELPGLIDRAAEIDPQDCRSHAAQNFDVARMVEGYEKAFFEAVIAPVTA